MITSITEPKVPSKLAKIMVYLPHDLKESLEKIADLEHRSMSNKILTLVEDEVKRAKSEGKI